MKNITHCINLFKKYHLYIMFLIMLIIMIIGFIWSYQVSNKEKTIEYIEEETKEEVIIETIKIDIKGSVKKPGVYELNIGSRVIDAIEKAGNLNKDADTSLINLSKKLSDEDVIIIYSNDEIKEYRETSKIEKYDEVEIECNCPDNLNTSCINEKTTSTEETNSLISINTANADKLKEISGLGDSKVKNIIEYRETNGPFNSIKDIKNVTGIGDSLFEKIKDYITI